MKKRIDICVAYRTEDTRKRSSKTFGILENSLSLELTFSGSRETVYSWMQTKTVHEQNEFWCKCVQACILYYYSDNTVDTLETKIGTNLSLEAKISLSKIKISITINTKYMNIFSNYLMGKEWKRRQEASILFFYRVCKYLYLPFWHHRELLDFDRTANRSFQAKTPPEQDRQRSRYLLCVWRRMGQQNPAGTRIWYSIHGQLTLQSDDLVDSSSGMLMHFIKNLGWARGL